MNGGESKPKDRKHLHKQVDAALKEVHKWSQKHIDEGFTPFSFHVWQLAQNRLERQKKAEFWKPEDRFCHWKRSIRLSIERIGKEKAEREEEKKRIRRKFWLVSKLRRKEFDRW